LLLQIAGRLLHDELKQLQLLFDSRQVAQSAYTCTAAAPLPHARLATAGEGQYSLKYGEVGTRVAIVSSEPITGSSDWVSVPRNTALIISQGKSGYVSILKSPLASSGKHPRQEEVMRCLEAVTSAAEVEVWPLHRHKRRRVAQSVGTSSLFLCTSPFSVCKQHDLTRQLLLLVGSVECPAAWGMLLKLAQDSVRC